jgi:4-hydroxy-2-oxoheptanedioate aldolase
MAPTAAPEHDPRRARPSAGFPAPADRTFEFNRSHAAAGIAALTENDPMDLHRNSFKHAIAAGKLQIGLWCSLCSNIAADVVGDSGFDWLLLDTEHSPNEIPDLVGQLQAVSGGTATPIVRPAWNDMVLIKRCLDIGAQTLLVPYVQNAEEARRAVEAVRYPPRGMRGVAVASRASRYGRVADYLKKADSEICLLVQVETRSALDQLEAIAAVDGIDGVFIGPSDLSASLGHIGNPAHPEPQKAMQDAAVRLKKIGKPAGILTGNDDEIRRYISWGYTFVAVGSDIGLLGRGADMLAKKYKS